MSLPNFQPRTITHALCWRESCVPSGFQLPLRWTDQSQARQNKVVSPRQKLSPLRLQTSDQSVLVSSSQTDPLSFGGERKGVTLNYIPQTQGTEFCQLLHEFGSRPFLGQALEVKAYFLHTMSPNFIIISLPRHPSYNIKGPDTTGPKQYHIFIPENCLEGLYSTRLSIFWDPIQRATPWLVLCIFIRPRKQRIHTNGIQILNHRSCDNKYALLLFKVLMFVDICDTAIDKYIG